MSRRIGLCGGSFNPIHVGHLVAARAAAEALHLDRVVLIPASAPPHKDAAGLVAAAHRLAMTRLAVQGDPLFEVSDLELLRQGPSYTIDTVTDVRARLGPTAELFWIIGGDSLPELATWRRIDELVRAVQIVTTVRPGCPAANLEPLRSQIEPRDFERLLANRIETPAIEISASDIRSRVAAGKSIAYLTPPAVVQYIETHRLYHP
jgi:nicotinate-nucleotide adenylyltransferase